MLLQAQGVRLVTPEAIAAIAILGLAVLIETIIIVTMLVSFTGEGSNTE